MNRERWVNSNVPVEENLTGGTGKRSSLQNFKQRKFSLNEERTNSANW